MGMDPIDENETYELTVYVQGPVNIADFQVFKTKLKAFLDEFTPTGSGGGVKNTHKKYPAGARPWLQVREGRGGQRKNP